MNIIEMTKLKSYTIIILANRTLWRSLIKSIEWLIDEW